MQLAAGMLAWRHHVTNTPSDFLLYVALVEVSRGVWQANPAIPVLIWVWELQAFQYSVASEIPAAAFGAWQGLAHAAAASGLLAAKAKLLGQPQLHVMAVPAPQPSTLQVSSICRHALMPITST